MRLHLQEVEPVRKKLKNKHSKFKHMKTKLILILVIAGLMLSFTFINTKNKGDKEVSITASTSAPVGGFAVEEIRR
jgi:hypothetical protein